MDSFETMYNSAAKAMTMPLQSTGNQMSDKRLQSMLSEKFNSHNYYGASCSSLKELNEMSSRNMMAMDNTSRRNIPNLGMFSNVDATSFQQGLSNRPNELPVPLIQNQLSQMFKNFAEVYPGNMPPIQMLYYKHFVDKQAAAQSLANDYFQNKIYPQSPINAVNFPGTNLPIPSLSLFQNFLNLYGGLAQPNALLSNSNSPSTTRVPGNMPNILYNANLDNHITQSNQVSEIKPSTMTGGSLVANNQNMFQKCTTTCCDDILTSNITSMSTEARGNDVNILNQRFAEKLVLHETVLDDSLIASEKSKCHENDTFVFESCSKTEDAGSVPSFDCDDMSLSGRYFSSFVEEDLSDMFNQEECSFAGLYPPLSKSSVNDTSYFSAQLYQNNLVSDARKFAYNHF